MQLQIQFIVPYRQIGQPLFQIMKKSLHRTLPANRQGAEGIETAAVLEHLCGRPAAPVAPAERKQHLVIDLLLAVGIPAALDSGGIQVYAVIAPPAPVRRSDKMAEDARAVHTLPEKGIMGEGGELIPTQFSGHKSTYSALFHNLRQRIAETETVRKPGRLRIAGQFAAEIPFAEKELTNQ